MNYLGNDIIIIGGFALVLWLLSLSYKHLWQILPRFFRYILFFPFSLLITYAGTVLFPEILFRDELYEARQSGRYELLTKYIIPILTPVIGIFLLSFLILLLCPKKEILVTKIILIFYIISHVTVWVYLMAFLNSYELKIMDVVISVLSIFSALIIYKKINDLANYIRN
jgi:hypothetical protein